MSHFCFRPASFIILIPLQAFWCLFCSRFHSAFRLYEMLAIIWIIFIVGIFLKIKIIFWIWKLRIFIFHLDIRSVKYPFNQKYESRQLYHNSCYNLKIYQRMGITTTEIFNYFKKFQIFQAGFFRYPLIRFLRP